MIILIAIWIGFIVASFVVCFVVLRSCRNRFADHEHYNELRENWEGARMERETWRDSHPYMSIAEREHYEWLWLVEVGAEELMNIFSPWTANISWSEYKLERQGLDRED